MPAFFFFFFFFSTFFDLLIVLPGELPSPVTSKP